MSLPEIRGEDRMKPVCYDPARRLFITIDDLLSGREKIVPLSTLSEEERRLLVIRRQELGPDYTVQAVSGTPMSRDDVISAIRRNDGFGAAAVEAELSYLKGLLELLAGEIKPG